MPPRLNQAAFSLKVPYILQKHFCCEAVIELFRVLHVRIAFDEIVLPYILLHPMYGGKSSSLHYQKGVQGRFSFNPHSRR